MKVGDLVQFIDRNGNTQLGIVLGFDKLTPNAVLLHMNSKEMWFRKTQVEVL